MYAAIDAHDRFGIELDLERLRVFTGLGDAQFFSVFDLCVRLLGTEPRYGDGPLPAVIVGGAVQFRRGLEPGHDLYAVACAVSRAWYRRTGLHGPQVWRRGRMLGAAIVAPRELVVDAIAAIGDDHRELARALRVPESLALLRVAEITGRLRALVKPNGQVIVRGRPGLHRAQMQRREITDVCDGRFGLVAC